MLQILIGLVFFILGIEFIKIIIELLNLETVKKVKCKTCSGLIDSSCLKCHLCEAFLEKKWKKLNKFFTYVERVSDRKMHRVIKKVNFWNGK